MARDITATVQGDLTASHNIPIFLAEIHNDGDTLYLATGIGTLPWNGHDWLGMGKFATIGTIPEASQVRADGIQLGLNGIDSDLLIYALNYARQGKTVRVYLAFLDSSNNVKADPILTFLGRSDQVEIHDTGSTGSINQAAENRLIDLGRPRQRRYESEDQKNEYSTDLGFDFVSDLQEMNLSWGAPGATIPQTSSGGGTVGNSSDNGREAVINP